MSSGIDVMWCGDTGGDVPSFKSLWASAYQQPTGGADRITAGFVSDETSTSKVGNVRSCTFTRRFVATGAFSIGEILTTGGTNAYNVAFARGTSSTSTEFGYHGSDKSIKTLLYSGLTSSTSSSTSTTTTTTSTKTTAASFDCGRYREQCVATSMTAKYTNCERTKKVNKGGMECRTNALSRVIDGDDASQAQYCPGAQPTIEVGECVHEILKIFVARSFKVEYADIPCTDENRKRVTQHLNAEAAKYAAGDDFEVTAAECANARGPTRRGRARRSVGITVTVAFSSSENTFHLVDANDLVVTDEGGVTRTAPSLSEIVSSGEPTDNNTAAIVGGVAGAVIVIIAIILYLRSSRRRERNANHQASAPAGISNGAYDIDDISVPENGLGNVRQISFVRGSVHDKNKQSLEG